MTDSPKPTVVIDVIRLDKDPFRSGRVRLRFDNIVLQSKPYIHGEDAQVAATRLIKHFGLDGSTVDWSEIKEKVNPEVKERAAEKTEKILKEIKEPGRGPLSNERLVEITTNDILPKTPSEFNVKFWMQMLIKRVRLLDEILNLEGHKEKVLKKEPERPPMITDHQRIKKLEEQVDRLHERCEELYENQIEKKKAEKYQSKVLETKIEGIHSTIEKVNRHIERLDFRCTGLWKAIVKLEKKELPNIEQDTPNEYHTGVKFDEDEPTTAAVELVKEINERLSRMEDNSPLLATSHRGCGYDSSKYLCPSCGGHSDTPEMA